MEKHQEQQNVTKKNKTINQQVENLNIKIKKVKIQNENNILFKNEKVEWYRKLNNC